VLRDELKNIEDTVTSDYSPDLADAVARGRLDLAFMRVEPSYDLGYHVVDREPLIVLMRATIASPPSKQFIRASSARSSSAAPTKPRCCGPSPRITCGVRERTSSSATGSTTLCQD